MEDNLVTDLVREPARRGVPVDLLFVNRERLADNVMITVQHPWKQWSMKGFGSWESKASRTATLGFWRADFGLFRTLVERESPLGGSSEGKRGPERLDILQEGNLKSAGADCPCMLKDESVGKKKLG